MKTETQPIPQVPIGMTEGRSSPLLADDLDKSDDDDEGHFFLQSLNEDQSNGDSPENDTPGPSLIRTHTNQF